MIIELFFVIFIFLLPLQLALNAGENFDLVTTRILVPAIFLLWIIRGMARKNIRIPNRAETWMLFSFLFLATLSLFFGLDPLGGTRKILYLFSIFPVYFVAVDLARNPRFRLNIVRAVWASGSLAAILALSQFSLPFVLGIEKTLKIWKNLAEFFLGSSFGKLVAENPSWLVNVSGNTWMRAFGFFPDPHMFSIFASLCFFVGLGYFFREKNKGWKIAVGAGEALMFFSIALSFSRGAYLGVIAGGLFFLVVLLVRRRSAGRVAVAGAILVFFAAVFFRGTIQNRLVSAFNFKEGSNVERVENWRQAAGIIRDYPLSGIGLGSYSSYVNPSSGGRSSVYAHDLFLDIAAETGILNGVVFMSLVLIAIWRNIRGKSAIGLGLAAGLFYFLVHGVFDTPIWSPQVMVILLTMVAAGLHSDEGHDAANSKKYRQEREE